MAREVAASRALSRSRDAMASMLVCWPFCMAGITFLRPMLAVLSTPQRSLFVIVVMIMAQGGFGPCGLDQKGVPSVELEQFCRLHRLPCQVRFNQIDRPQNAGRQWTQIVHVLRLEEFTIAIPQKPIIRQRLPGQ